MRWRTSAGSASLQVDAVEQDAARLRVVEALGELEDGGLARARRADHGEPLVGPDLEAEAVERRGVLAGRIVEGDVLELEARPRPARAAATGLAGALISGSALEQLVEPLRRAGGAQQVAIDFAQGAERAGQQAAVEDEGGDGAAGHPARARHRPRPAR